MEYKLTPLAKKLMEVCDKEEDYLEILKFIDYGLRDHFDIIKKEINDKLQEFYEDMRDGNNISQWQEAWKQYHAETQTTDSNES